MNNKKCYGRKKTIIPKEKSFIRNFFDGNQSSDLSAIESSSNEKNQKNICSENEKNILGDITNSPVLFYETYPLESSSQEQICPGQKKNIKVANKIKYGKKKTYQKKTYKGIQHLSTKYCKSLQPCWSEFEQHDFIIERHRRASHAANKKPENFDKLSNSKITKSNVPVKNHITSKNIETMKSKKCVFSHDTVNSSGELFVPILKKKKSMLKGKSFKKRTSNIHSLIKKQDDSISKNTMTEKVIQCRESNSPVKSKNTVDISFENIILPQQEVKHSQKPMVASEISNIVSQMNEIFPSVTREISKNQKDSDSKVVPPSNVDIDYNSGELFVNSNCKSIESSLNNSQSIPSCKVKHPELEHYVSKCTVEGISNNDNCSLSLVLQRQTVENNISEENSIIQVCKCNSERQSVEKCKSLTSNADVSHKSKCYKLMKLEEKSNTYSFKKNEILALKCNSPKSSFKKDNKDLNSIALSPNVSHIIQSCNSIGKKVKGNFATSTPVLSRKAYDFEKMEALSLPNSEKASNFKQHSKNSICEIFLDGDYLACTDTLGKDTLFNICQNKSVSPNFQNSLLLNLPPNLLHNRKSISNPHRNTSIKKNGSMLDVSSRNVLLAEENLEFTKTNLLTLCDQDTVVAFSDIYSWKNLKVKKIGEGTYGEVYMITKCKSSSVLKVIPVTEDPTIKNLQGLLSAFSEVKITKCLSGLRNNKKNQSKNFIKLIRSSVVSGLYPHSLINAWDKYSKIKTTFNERPDIYDDNQLFVILELEYGGTDMSTFVIKNAVEAQSILKQIAVSLAVAEDEFSFEHRDLHLGNILVKRNRSKTASYKLRGKDISFQCHGLQVTIIDFTLSLLFENGYTYYFDLAEDVSLFEQTGDYQFDVYRYMKKHLQNKWEECSLYSNVLWLKYLCQKMKECKYSCALTASQKKGLKIIDFFNSELMKCNCAMECLEKWRVTTTVFQRNCQSMSQARRSILVSRNSTQKSKLSICN